jgi:hypothetical protein
MAEATLNEAIETVTADACTSLPSAASTPAARD